MWLTDADPRSVAVQPPGTVPQPRRWPGPITRCSLSTVRAGSAHPSLLPNAPTRPHGRDGPFPTLCFQDGIVLKVSLHATDAIGCAARRRARARGCTARPRGGATKTVDCRRCRPGWYAAALRLDSFINAAVAACAAAQPSCALHRPATPQTHAAFWNLGAGSGCGRGREWARRWGARSQGLSLI